MNQVEQSVFKMLANRQRLSKKTDIPQFTKYLKHVEPNASEKDVLEVFKKLQEEGYGSVIIGRGDKPTRFIWDYNLKDVAQKVLGNEVEVMPLDASKRSVKTRKTRADKGMPRTKKPRKIAIRKPSELKQVQPVISINLKLGEGTSVKDIQALLELANSLKV